MCDCEFGSLQISTYNFTMFKLVGPCLTWLYNNETDCYNLTVLGIMFSGMLFSVVFLALHTDEQELHRDS